MIEWRTTYEGPGGLGGGEQIRETAQRAARRSEGDPVDLNDVDPNLANSRGIIWLREEMKLKSEDPR